MNEQQLFHFTLQKIQEAVVWTQRNGKVYNVNEAACSFFKLGRSELLEKSVFDLNRNIDSKEKWDSLWLKLQKEKSLTLVNDISIKEKIIPVRINLNLFSLKSQEFTCTVIHDLTKENEYLDLLKKITIGTQSLTGEPFFAGLAKAITEAMKTEYVLMTECVNVSKDRVRTLAYAHHNIILDNIEYDLAETPCLHVMEGNEYCCETGLESKFKKEKGLESYYGVPIFGEDRKEILGHIAVLGTRPFEPNENQKEILRIFSNRLGAEILRKNFERKLSQANKELTALKDRLQDENVYLKEEINLSRHFSEIITHSKLFKKVLKQVEQVAPSNASVLITGETGTGKELLARAVHNNSQRKKHPMIKVNCAAMPAQLIESELFGHVKGAFTGAVIDKKGKFEIANNGTIFLDEIGELPIELQPKLLRVLQEGEIERVGDSKTIKVDVRLIAATNRDLEKEIEQGNFRSDLYFRLNVFPIESPPLLKRKEDIEPLAIHFARKFAAENNKKIDSVEKSSLKKLMEYHWPGNVRELENVIERAVIISTSPVLKVNQNFLSGSSAPSSEVWDLQSKEKEHILKALETTNWKVSGATGAAKLLNIKPTTLEARMKKLGIKRG